MAVRKQRIDRYYNMAKDRGYRARSAFKLLELNKKYNIIKNANIAVDLCAAPGGWLQILAQEMPVCRKIIGIDLDPIKPLGGDVMTFVGDITTIECRKTLIGCLNGHQADIFVHDGAPNFGAAKEKDHFVQNDLVLHALKLTVEFLKQGGTFVTKIFRSENFSEIVRVLEELFEYVDVTKPLSSRSESAEIFAVCRNFRNPDYINPDYFDSNALFRQRGDEQVENNYRKIKLSEYFRSRDRKLINQCVTIVPDFECSQLTDKMREMMTDLKLLTPNTLHNLAQKLEKLKVKIEKGLINVPILADLVKSREEEDESEVSEEKDKMDELNEALERERKQKERREREDKKALSRVKRQFYNDRIFKAFEMLDTTDCDAAGDNDPGRDNAIVDVSSCSDSMEMTESEMRCAIEMKLKGDEFEYDTIDRYVLDKDDIVLPIEKRPSKLNEPRMQRKKMEIISKKKARALRRANKAMTDIAVENDEEEAVVYKKVFKSMYKKERHELRLVFPCKNKGTHVKAPKGKGKVKLLDSRMKHDLYIQKKRQKSLKSQKR